MRGTHTPGPWSYCYTSARQARDGDSDGGGASGSVYAKGKGLYDTVTVAYLPHHRDIKEDATREANARLMAAAPDLLEALQDCQARLRLLVDADRHKSLDAVALHKADAAIAKATHK